MSEEKTELSLLKSQTETLPTNTSKEEYTRRDGIIPSYIINHDWYVSAEFHLVRTLVMKPPLKWIEFTGNQIYPAMALEKCRDVKPKKYANKVGPKIKQTTSI